MVVEPSADDSGDLVWEAASEEENKRLHEYSMPMVDYLLYPPPGYPPAGHSGAEKGTGTDIRAEERSKALQALVESAFSS